MYQGKTLSLQAIENGFVEINFDSQSGSVNKFNQETLGELQGSSEDRRGHGEYSWPITDQRQVGICGGRGYYRIHRYVCGPQTRVSKGNSTGQQHFHSD